GGIHQRRPRFRQPDSRRRRFCRAGKRGDGRSDMDLGLRSPGAPLACDDILAQCGAADAAAATTAAAAAAAAATAATAAAAAAATAAAAAAAATAAAAAAAAEQSADGGRR